MAERIVSPGVFTRERDLSFLPQAIGAIGAAIIGPTQKGPAFVPTQVTSFQDFEEIFGGQDERFYWVSRLKLSITVRSNLRVSMRLFNKKNVKSLKS